MRLHKSLMAALLGLTLAVGFGIGVTQIHASVQQPDSSAAGACCPIQCPTDASKAACPVTGAQI